MRDLTTILAKFLEICKDFSLNLANESGNVPRRGVVPKFSDLEVIALSMTAEHFSIDSESLLFHILHKYECIDGGESFFCVDSKPIEVCKIARASRCKFGRGNWQTAPNKGYCASQSCFYYGYKLHALCGLSGVIHYMKDLRLEYRNCSIFGDKGNLSLFLLQKPEKGLRLFSHNSMTSLCY